jgi:hypothetical protein
MTDFGIEANFTLNSYVIRWGWTQSNDFFIVGLELSPFIQPWRCAGNFRMESYRFGRSQSELRSEYKKSRFE